MKYMDYTKEGLLNLYHSKLRALLALIGVLVGTASVVAMVLGGELATNEALKQFKSLGIDLLSVSLNSSSDERSAGSGKSESLTLEQAEQLRNADPAILRIAPYTQLFHPMLYNGEILNSAILGVTEIFADIAKVKIKSGRFISMADAYSYYCVIGHDVYEAMRQISGVEPLGKQIQIGDNYFIVIGIADSWPEKKFIFADINNTIMIPLLASTTISKYTSLNTILIRLSANASIPQVERKITAQINQSVTGKQISFRSAQELIAKMKKQSDILTIFLGLIGSISLLVGGIGVMNIMLVSVTERRREIGIRIAVGATRRDICMLFLAEAITLSLIGGVIGVVIGIIIAYLISVFSHWEFTLFLWPPLVGFAVSVSVGIFFGFYPAYLASKLDPINALKSE